MSGLTNALVAQQVQALLDTQKRQTDYLTAWLGGSPTGGPNNDGRYPFVDLAGVEILVPAPATFNNMTSGPAALAVAAKAAAELARDLAKGHADRANDQRILAEAARGAAIDARNLAQEHKNRAGTSEANAEYWANLARASGQGSSENREIVEQLAEQVADNAALASQDADDAAASAALAATFDPALFDKTSDTLAASRLSGIIDIARIPVLPSQLQFVSSGGLENLTTAQQSGIGRGSIVTTTDGFRYVYSGSGSKTLAASYTVLADITPAWDSVTNKPAYFPSNIGNVAGLQSALDAKLSSGAAITVTNVAFNTGLLYPDGNHTVIKTGAAGAERYWRFDGNGTFYALNGGLYTNWNIQGMGNLTIGATTGADRANLEKGWLELRNINGPYIDLSKDGTADFHARLQYQTDNNFNITANGGRVGMNSGGSVVAYNPGGRQAGEVLTDNGSEQTLFKQLTFPSGQNPQDAGASAMLEVKGGGGGYGAWMKFHRPGAYGTYFGMFEDGKWGFGGWSTGATIYEFWTSKNLDANGLMRRYCDGWNTTTDGNERFYFATNGRSYYRSRDGHEWRNTGDVWIGAIDNAGNYENKGFLSTQGNSVKIKGGSPTIYFLDSDQRSAMIHVNSNTFHILRGAGAASEGWEAVRGRWPLQINLENNDAQFGGEIFTGDEGWFRVRGSSGVFWENYGGGWHMSDTSWIRAYGNKGIYTPSQVRGNTVVGESDIRLKQNVEPILDATAKVASLHGVTFDWIKSGKPGMGFIAQDFETVLPALVTEDTDGMKGVEYGPVVALLVEALKETNARLDVLESGRD